MRGDRSFVIIHAVRCLQTLLLMLVVQSGQAATEEEAIASAEASFKFIASSLQHFQRSGQIDSVLGLDGSEYEDFLALMRSSYGEFKQGFERGSALCRFYLDPENGRIEIEERANMGMQYLPALSARLQRYREVDARFQEMLVNSFGGGLLNRIQNLKYQATSYEYLPSWDLNAAEAIQFADTACSA